jgi:hypothetical protein
MTRARRWRGCEKTSTKLRLFEYSMRRVSWDVPVSCKRKCSLLDSDISGSEMSKPWAVSSKLTY